MKRTIYLDKRPWKEALDLFLGTFKDQFPLPEEEIQVENALGRVAASDIHANHPSPHYNASAMDGVAVKSGETAGADLSAPKRLRKGETFHFVDTGAPLPDGFNAVIMIEDIHQVDEETIEIHSAVAPFHHVRRIGEDIKQDDLLVPANKVITPYDIGALLAGGVTAIPVRKKPRVGILPTGSELVEPGSQLNPGDIVEFNSRMVKALVTQWGAQGHRYTAVPDEAEAIRQHVQEIVNECDLSIIIAGSSAGRRDFTPGIIEELGELLVHGVNVMPGKPVVLGRIDTKPVIGLPGYPVSAAVIMDLFAMPLICTMLGLPPLERPKIRARLTQNIYSKLGMEEFVRVTVARENDETTATPLTRGAGILTSLTKADGILRIPANFEGFETGRDVEVELLNEPWRSVP